MCLSCLDNILHLIIVVTKCLRKVAQMVDGKQRQSILQAGSKIFLKTNGE